MPRGSRHATRTDVLLWTFSGVSAVAALAPLVFGNATPSAAIGIVLAIAFGLLAHHAGDRPEVACTPDAIRELLRLRISSRLNEDLRGLGGADLIPLTLAGPRGSRLRTVQMADLGVLVASPTSNRIAMTGVPGSGKTVALHALARTMINLGADALIPVFLEAEQWRAQTIREWIVETLVGVYKIEPESADALYANGQVAALVDGLDEMDSREESAIGPLAHPRATRLLGELQAASAGMLPLPFALTCQTIEYRRLTREGSTVPGTIELQVMPVDLARLCLELSRSPKGLEWKTLLDSAPEDERSRLTTMLSVPFFLRLATSSGTKGVLNDPAHLPRASQKHLETLLLRSFVSQRLGLASGVGVLADTEQTLRTIARWLVENETTAREFRGRTLPIVDIVPHRLWPIAGERRPRVVTAILAILILSPVVPVTSWTLAQASLSVGATAVVWFAVATVFCLAVRNSLRPWPHPKRLVWSRIFTRQGALRLAGSILLAAVLSGLTLDLEYPDFAVGLFVGFVLTFGLGATLGVRDSAPNLSLLSAAAVLGLPFALLAAQLTRALGYTAGLAVGLAVGTFTLLISVEVTLRATRAPSGYRLDPRPYPFVRNDLLTGLVSAMTLTAALAPALVLLPSSGFTLAPALAVTSSVGFCSGLGLVSDTWRRQLATSVCMPGRLSFNLGTVLNRALKVGLLRRAGVSYQFKHRKIRDELAR